MPNSVSSSVSLPSAAGKHETESEFDASASYSISPASSSQQSPRIPFPSCVPSASSGPSSAAPHSEALTQSERRKFRSRLREIYARNVTPNEADFHALANIAASLEEEILYSSSLSRLEYLKSGIEVPRLVDIKLIEIMEEKEREKKRREHAEANAQAYGGKRKRRYGSESVSATSSDCESDRTPNNQKRKAKINRENDDETTAIAVPVPAAPSAAELDAIAAAAESLESSATHSPLVSSLEFLSAAAAALASPLQIGKGTANTAAASDLEVGELTAARRGRSRQSGNLSQEQNKIKQPEETAQEGRKRRGK